MGIHIHQGTMSGAVTPICNDCGISLCYDIDNGEYESAAAFWDAWVCTECNNGVPLSLKTWKAKASEVTTESHE